MSFDQEAILLVPAFCDSDTQNLHGVALSTVNLWYRNFDKH